MLDVCYWMKHFSFLFLASRCAENISINYELLRTATFLWWSQKKNVNTKRVLNAELSCVGWEFTLSLCFFFSSLFDLIWRSQQTHTNQTNEHNERRQINIFVQTGWFINRVNGSNFLCYFSFYVLFLRVFLILAWKWFLNDLSNKSVPLIFLIFII